jgi:uncharacterized protein YkwD
VRRGLQLIALAAIFALLLPHSAGAATGATSASFSAAAKSANTYCADPEEMALLADINQYREANGLDDLTLSPTLGAAAKHHSESMANFNYFDTSHDLRFEGPDQDQTITWQQNIANAGYPDNTHTSRAENLAAGYETAAETLAQWQHSPSHNEHLLSDKYQAIGIGEAYNPSSEYKWYWTVTFGSLIDATAGACTASSSGGDGTPAPGTQLSIRSSGRNGSSTESDVAYDGDPGTAWYTTKARTPNDGYVWFDLGDLRQLSSIQYLFSESGAADQFEIQVSPDKQDWTTIAELGNPPAGAWQSLDWTGEARYVRFYFSNPNGDKVLGYLAEVRFFA